MNNCSNTKYHSVNTDHNNDGSDQTSTDKFRFVEKNGRINVNYASLGRVKNMHSNVILFIMEADWWLVLSFVLLSFILSWFFFALLYFLVSIKNGDIVFNDKKQNLFENHTNYTSKNFKFEKEKKTIEFLRASLDS